MNEQEARGLAEAVARLENYARGAAGWTILFGTDLRLVLAALAEAQRERDMAASVADKLSSTAVSAHEETEAARREWMEVNDAVSAQRDAAQAEAAKLKEAARAILHDPYGCPFCDSGVLRKRVDGSEARHDENCGWALLSAALSAPPSTAATPERRDG
jgi:hypothetical protein